MMGSITKHAPRIGVLALQGAFIEHERMLIALGAECVELRQLKDMEDGLDGLVLPGGESSVQVKLLKELNMYAPLEQLIHDGLPVLATCAGLILLAEDISNDSRRGFASLPVRVQRNAYGRQLGSFTITEEFKGLGPIVMKFIRAPRIEKLLSDEAEVLSRIGDNITAVRFRNQIAMSFHPELGTDMGVHAMFLNIVSEYLESKKNSNFLTQGA